MAYLKRFDNSRNTKIYLITCICTFLAGSLLWMVLGAFSHFAYPFGLVSEPVMMAVFSFFAFKRKELRTLWEGKFYD